MHNSTLDASNPNQPIGIFDSGVGGLSIAKCIAQMLPNEALTYVADSKFAPYGKLTPEQIVDRVNMISDQLIAKGVKAIVIACNTATVIAIDQLRARVNIPIIGVEPAIKPAVTLSKTNSVGLLVTQATSKNTRFLNLVDQYRDTAKVHIQPCPDLAHVIEQGHANTDKSFQLLLKYLTPLVDKNIDALVLGCTHYPFVSKQIQAITGNEIILIETAKPVTLELIRQLEQRNLLANTTRTQTQFYSTNCSDALDVIFNDLWFNDLLFNELNHTISLTLKPFPI